MENSAPRFSLLRTFKIGSFNIGSAFADILITGVWNRILISELSISATPIAFLIGLRYLLAPLSLWFGHRSDSANIFGKRRLPFIYFGRLLLWLALPLLPLVVAELARDSSSVFGWSLAAGIFLLYGLGTFISGAPFLALARASAPPSRRGMVVLIVETFLLAGFAIAPITYSIVMHDYTIEGFWQLVGIAMVGGLLAWTVSVWGEERPAEVEVSTPGPKQETIPFPVLIKRMWGQRNTRFFFGVLAMGAIALFAQDAIMEPLGAELFGLSVGQTTRFSAYYGVGVLVTMVIGAYLTRKRLPQEQTRLTGIGLVLVMVTLLLLVITAWGHFASFINTALFLFGVASGVYSVGGLNLMVAMTDEKHAGAYLGVWSLSQLVFRGIGIGASGFIMESVQHLTGIPASGYVAVFAIEIVAAGVALYCLGQASKEGYLFTPNTPTPATMEAVAAAGD